MLHAQFEKQSFRIHQHAQIMMKMKLMQETSLPACPSYVFSFFLSFFLFLCFFCVCVFFFFRNPGLTDAVVSQRQNKNGHSQPESCSSMSSSAAALAGDCKLWYVANGTLLGLQALHISLQQRV